MPPSSARVAVSHATSGKRPRRAQRYGRYQVLHAFVTSRFGFVPATGEQAVTLSYRYLLPVSATEQAVEQAALRRLRLRRRRLRRGGGRSGSSSSGGSIERGTAPARAGRGSRRSSRRAATRRPRPQGTPQSRASSRTLAAPCASTSTPSRRSRGSRAPPSPTTTSSSRARTATSSRRSGPCRTETSRPAS